MENLTTPNPLASLPMDELTNYYYYSQLLEQAKDPKLQIPANKDTPVLMPFNGYYSLNAMGAFFAIDTNMVVHSLKSPHYDLSLLISLDGITSTRYAFTGTFDGANLIQEWPTVNGITGLSINLTFTRTNTPDGTTATVTGSIALPGRSAVSVAGSTYNNPIPASLFIGDYWTVPKQDSASVKVMSIGSNNKLMYDDGTKNGNLMEITAYVYNLNMYYFSFQQDASTNVKLIMGTAGSQGFACNNMTVNGLNVVSRSLVTIPGSTEPPFQLIDLSGVKLADFSGYYQIPTKEYPLAFFSVQAKYITLSESLNLDLNYVEISYSSDGITSKGLYFDPFDISAPMSFDNTTNVLTIAASDTYPAMSLTFTRQYNKKNGSLVNVAGTIGTAKVEGSTLFNPVPLKAFGGVTMTNSKGEKLTINNDNSITYSLDGGSATTDNSLIYVPLMYIVAAPPVKHPAIMLSLGTDGLRGLACIVITNPGTASSTTTSVYAINGPE